MTESAPNPISFGPQVITRPLAVLVFGLLILALLLGSRDFFQRTEREDSAWIQAVATVESDVAICHLWIEEHVSGDQVRLDEVDARLERSRRYLDAMLGTVDQWVDESLILRPLPGPASSRLRQETRDLRDRLETFRQISEDRRLGLERGLAVGIGSAFDVAYDEAFDQLMMRIQVLRGVLIGRREAAWSREQVAVNLLAVLWAAVTFLASFALWERENHRRLTELELAKSRAHVVRVERARSVGRLAGGLAHDLGNHLAAIRAQCELAQRKASDGDVRTKMQTAISVLDKASALVDRQMSFHRGVRGGIGDRLERVDLNAVLRDLEETIRSVAGPEVEVQFDLAPRVWKVDADPVTLEQAVTNLVANARDAMPGGGRIDISTRTRRGRGDAEDCVCLSIRDTGQGIEPENLERIFEPFWSSKTQGVADASGPDHSGLGLAIVDAVVFQMGGSVSVDSTPGAGTTFFIELPRARGAEAYA